MDTHGLALHSKARNTNTCRFCKQALSTARRSAIEDHFNDAFAAQQQELDSLLAKLKAAKQAVSSLHLPERSQFYDHLSAEANEALDDAKESVGTALDVVDDLIVLVQAKRDNPFSVLDSIAAARAKQYVHGLTKAVAGINTVIGKHNATTEDFKQSVEHACKRLEGAYVAEVHGEYVRLRNAANSADDALERATEHPKIIQAEVDALERQILEHRRPADELTNELRAYLGRDELRFEVKGIGYVLTRGGQPVAHLSEGERTAIAFLYFLKALQDKTFDLANGVVVIDDPVSSLDANALFSAFGYMKERTKQCGQLIVFTHSFAFFRLVKNWFHHLSGQNRKNIDLRPCRFFLLRSRRHTDGSRASHLGPLDRLLHEYESEYQYLFKRVYDEAHRSDVDSLEHHYGLPNVARRLVEAFLAFRFPDAPGELSPRLDRVNFDSTKKTRILRLLNTYSHSGAVGEPEHDLFLLAEAQPAMRDVLEMMETVDPVHYAGMKNLVSAGAV